MLTPVQLRKATSCRALSDTIRRRGREDTIPTMVTRIEFDMALEVVKATMRKEFVANIDRQALERAIADATKAHAMTEAARATSLTRYLKLLGSLAALFVIVASQYFYSHENRARLDEIQMRIDRMERLADKIRGTTEWRNWPDVR